MAILWMMPEAWELSRPDPLSLDESARSGADRLDCYAPVRSRTA